MHIPRVSLNHWASALRKRYKCTKCSSSDLYRVRKVGHTLGRGRAAQQGAPSWPILKSIQWQWLSFKSLTGTSLQEQHRAALWFWCSGHSQTCIWHQLILNTIIRSHWASCKNISYPNPAPLWFFSARFARTAVQSQIHQTLNWTNSLVSAWWSPPAREEVRVLWSSASMQLKLSHKAACSGVSGQIQQRVFASHHITTAQKDCPRWWTFRI